MGTLTQPGSTGTQTITCPSGSNPKAILMWAVGTASDTVAAHELLGVGFAANIDPFGTSMEYNSFSAEDAVGTQDSYVESTNTSTLVLHNGTTGAIDLEIDVTTWNTGDVTIDWINLFTTASIRVHYLIFGGSDVTLARTGNFSVETTDADQDVTIESGFGKPELVFFANIDNSGVGLLSAGSISFGFAKQGEAGRCISHTAEDGNTNAVVSQSIWNNQCIVCLDDGGGTMDARGGLDTTVSNWPTDGFNINWNSTPSYAARIAYLAIRTSATITTGEGSAPTSGGLPVNQDLNHGSVPKCALVINARTATANTVDTTSTDCGMIGIGGGDGTNEMWCGVMNDDALGTMDANRASSVSKSIKFYSAATPAVTSEADGSITGNNFRLAWNDIDATAFLYEWLTLGDGSAAAPTSLLAAPRPAIARY